MNKKNNKEIEKDYPKYDCNHHLPHMEHMYYLYT